MQMSFKATVFFAVTISSKTSEGFNSSLLSAQKSKAEHFDTGLQIPMNQAQ